MRPAYDLLTALVLLGLAAAPAIAEESPQRVLPAAFTEHAGRFAPRVHAIEGRGVWSLNNLDDFMSNSILIEGDDGVVLYDTGVSVDHGRAILREVRKITDKPIRAIIYSHHHPDHISGTTAIVAEEEVRSGRIPVYAWQNFLREHADETGVTGPIMALRAIYYAGLALGPEEQHYHGCCGRRFEGASGYVEPNTLIDATTDLVIAGVAIRLFHTGGEAASEIGAYLPERKIAILGDEIYPALPNLHSIRGTRFRDVDRWIAALDLVRSLDVEVLLGTHLAPIQGREEIDRVVTTYRDAIQYLHDQSVRYINKGYTPIELQHRLADLPDHLDLDPYTRPIYGKAQHIVPEFFTGYVSWFSGDAVDLAPTEPVESATRYVALIGGREKVLAAAKRALDDDDPQFAAELATLLIRTDHEDRVARQLKASAFRRLGYSETNTTWRSWYLTAALELEGKFDPLAEWRKLMGTVALERFSTARILDNLRYKVDADRAGDARIVLGYRFTDTDEKFGLELRHGILIVTEGSVPARCDAVLTLTREFMNRVLRKQDTYFNGIMTGAVRVEGDPTRVAQLYGYLDLELKPVFLTIR